jgi:cytochrome o ubiquinol oxidase subunit 3
MSDQAISTNLVHSDDHGFNNIASTRLFGFWIYVMSDCILFASLFATYAVLGHNYAGGPTGKQIFDLRGVIAETSALLISSFTYGLAVLAMLRGAKKEVIAWLSVTFLLGATFVGLEVNEFSGLVHDGFGPQKSAFLSSFFALVGTHGAHVSTGLIWMAVLIVQVAKKGITQNTSTRIMLLSLFWHFLDIVWICLFTIVYLMGVL